MIMDLLNLHILIRVEMSNTSIQAILASGHDDSATSDFELARINIHTMVQTATDAIDELADIAKQSQHPRAFEVLAKLIDSTVAANKSLLDLQDKIRQIKNADIPSNEKAQTINNNLFVGSTAELQRLIKNIHQNPPPNRTIEGDIE